MTQQTTEDNWVKPFAFILSLFAIIVTEPLYRFPLFESSLTIIKQLQATSTPALIKVMEIISAIGGVGIVFGTLILMFLLTPKARSFYYVCVYGMMLYVMSIGKLAYHCPRPYMVDDDINVYGCATEFGHPSGHSLNSMTFCIVIFADFLATYPNSSNCAKASVGIVAIITPLLVGFSRLYNGDHTLDQIIYGWTLGIWLAMLCHFCFRDFTLSHVSQLTDYASSTFTKNDYIRFFMGATCMFVATMGTIMLTFDVVDENFTVPADWVTRLKNKCGKDITLFSFNGASLIEGGAMAMFLGGYYGMLYMSINLQGKQGNLSITYCSFVIKLIVSVLLFIPFIVPIFLEKSINDAYDATIIYTLIPTFGLGLILYGISDMVVLYFGCASVDNTKKLQKLLSQNNSQQSYNVVVI